MKHYIGVDVGKHSLEVFYNKTAFSANNTSAGIKKLITCLEKDFLSNLQQDALVVFEATGGYERLLQERLAKANIAYHKAHPNKIRAFAKATGTLAKTDKIDAKLMARYATCMNLSADSPRETEEIKYLLKRREQLLFQKIQESNRLDKLLPKTIKKDIREHIRQLEKRIKKIDDALAKAGQEDSVKETVNLLTSIPGVGPMTACYFFAYLPELKTASSQQLVALVGVAPLNRDSGSFNAPSLC